MVRTGLALIALLCLLPGCVSRKLFIRSSPPGARVILDGEDVGTTPYETDFLSYGTRSVELELDGHRRLIEPMDVERPWWQYPPFDLATDLFIPWTIESHFSFDYALQPYGPSTATMDDARAAYARMRETLTAMDEAFAKDVASGEGSDDGDEGDDTDAGSDTGTDTGTDEPGGS